MKFFKIIFFILVCLVILNIVFADKKESLDEDDKLDMSRIVIEKAKEKPEEKQRVIILFNKKPKEYKKFIKSLDGEIIYDYGIIEGLAVEVSGKNIKKLKKLENIVSIQEDREVHATLDKSIPLIKADAVWALGFTGSDVKVCIIDTGIDKTHPALSGKVILEKDFVNNDLDASDDNGHGTHVAGIVASTDATFKGVAHGANLMSAKVLDMDGSGTISNVIAGIDWCNANGADVISLSLGGGLFTGTCDDQADAAAVNGAFDKGSVVVVASGNEGQIDKTDSPGCASKAIAVGAVYDDNVGSRTWCFNPPSCTQTCTDSTTSADLVVCFSNGGSELDVTAPGSVTTSTQLGGGFVGFSGTSMATPHVSGVAALLLHKNPDLTPSQVKKTIEQSAVDLGTVGWDNRYGWGRVDALAAVNQVPFITIKNIRVYDVTGKNTHTDITNLVKEGTNRFFYLKPGNTYRVEIDIKNSKNQVLTLTATDNAIHESLNSSWTVDNVNDIWYSISGVDFTGGSWSNGKVSWDTSLSGSINSGGIATFKYVFAVPSTQGKETFNVHSDFQTSFGNDEDFSKFSFKTPVCFVLFNKGFPHSTLETPYINALESLGYSVEYNTVDCRFDGSNIKDNSANFTGFAFWAHSLIWESSINFFANAKTHYVDTLKNNELILGQDATFLGDFGYATSNIGLLITNDASALVTNVDSVLPSTDYSVGQVVQVYNSCGANKHCWYISTNGNLGILVVGVSTYLDTSEGGDNKRRVYGNYQNVGRMGFFGLGRDGLSSGLTTTGDDNGKEILQYLTKWLEPVGEIIDITLIGYPLDFSNVNYGTSNNVALGNNLSQYKVKVESTTNVNVNIFKKGDDFVSGSNIIDSTNVKYDDDNFVDEIVETGLNQLTLSNTYPVDAYFTNVAPGTENNFYYWVTIPSGQKGGHYESTIFIKAIKA